MKGETRIKSTSILLFASTIIAISSSIVILYKKRKRKGKETKKIIKTSISSSSSSCYESLIGNTALVSLKNISLMIGENITIYVKMECNNPGGTGKDRAALSMIKSAEESNVLDKNGGGIVIEGTSGSTGISLAHICRIHNHKCIIFMPDDQANEKSAILKVLGAEIQIVPNCSISNPNHYVNRAKQMADSLLKERNNVLFANQFENKANFNAHFRTTGPEIYHQLGGHVDAFIMSSGTGGTISGVGTYLKQQLGDHNCKVVLVDPPGSVLHSIVQHDVAYVTEQCERNMLRHRYDTIAEGIGLDRRCNNFSLGLDIIDDSIKVTDQEAIDMAHYILHHEGLLIGSSSAMNLVGAIKVALDLQKENHNTTTGRQINVVTVLCDSGYRHLTRFWNRDFIANAGLSWPPDYVNDKLRIPQCLR